MVGCGWVGGWVGDTTGEQCQAISYTVRFRQSKTAIFDWILLVPLLIVSRVDFIVLVLFFLLIEAVGAREYCCTAKSTIGWQLCQLCFARSSRVTRASRATNLRQSGLVALGLAESRQSYV